ncbi:beta-1,4-glucuronyltransferase 1 isoform X2 [Neocloeon triangulifer]|nr:beta-1,4-glucuronyltransferase 1 isoform X2 [Neocloeon triangulifer]XP_059482375.1 beta-1,4-glucuronyltransferase 1 isoform X2 [Neocloeon triangulifer]
MVSWSARVCGCRFWSLSILGVVLVTCCNVLLTIRMLQNSPDCETRVLPAMLAPPPGPPGAKPRPSVPPVSNASEDGPVKEEFSVNLQLGRWDARRLYKMFDWTSVGAKYVELSQRFCVCLATQSSLDRLFSLAQVAHQWAGPISVALFIASPDELKIAKVYVKFIRNCYPTVRDRVSFHVAIPKEHPSFTSEARMSAGLENEKLDCSKPEASLRLLMRHRRPEAARWRVKLPYPQNHMRNLARRNCQTGHVFVTDVDIVPSGQLAEKLDAFLRKQRCSVDGHCAFVIPTYELDERVRFPQNKSELVRLAKKGLARPFHQKVFIYNQFATNFTKWQMEPEINQEVHVSHNVTNFEFLYEPFYVAPDTVPAHDERFIGYGYTRNTQVYETFVAGFQFRVLSPIFTVHWGLQNKKSRPGWRERQNSLNRRNFEIFKREVFARYQKDPLRMLNPRVKHTPINTP